MAQRTRIEIPADRLIRATPPILMVPGAVVLVLVLVLVLVQVQALGRARVRVPVAGPVVRVPGQVVPVPVVPAVQVQAPEVKPSAYLHSCTSRACPGFFYGAPAMLATWRCRTVRVETMGP